MALSEIDTNSIVARNIVMARHIEELLIEFKKENIDIILLKGAAFIFMFKESMAKRLMTDIDILVKSRDIKKAQLLIKKIGYRFIPGNSELVYAKEGGLDVFLDLHSGLFYIEEDEIWSAAKTIKTDSFHVKVLSSELNIIYLAYHMGVKHGSINKKWFKDMDLIIRNSALNWDEILKKADKYKLREVVSCAVLKTIEIHKTPVENKILTILQPRSAIKAFVFKKKFSNMDGNIPFSDYFLPILIHPSYALKVFPSPSFIKKRYKTSGPFVFVFYVYRPFELVFKGLRGLINFSISIGHKD